MTYPQHELCLPQNFAPQRLDKALELLFPNTSLRSRRALWEQWRITVNNTPRAAGFTVTAHDHIRLYAKTPQQSIQQPLPEVRIVHRHEPWLFFSKPQGMHTTRNTDAQNISLEDSLTNLPNIPKHITLCNRLDQQTSGIVVAAEHAMHVTQWRDAENNGHCQKRYVALVQSAQELIPYTVTNALDTHKRKISRILLQASNALRHTYFMPLGLVDKASQNALSAWLPCLASATDTLTLMGCTIYKGARHQIRAHAAHAGFPLVGDTRYRLRNVPKEEAFLLHHGSLRFPHGFCQCLPPWLDVISPPLAQKVQQFFSDTDNK